MLINPQINTSKSTRIQGEIPTSLQTWLTYQDSLTDRLKARAGNAHLQVLTQCLEPPDWWDKHVLGIGGDTVLHREILMWASHQPCWYARSFIPRATLQNNKQLFDRLQNESLGALIFNNPQVTRAYIINYSIDEQSIEYHWLDEAMHGGAKELWVRSSAFMINTRFPFYLIEILLPALERYPN